MLLAAAMISGERMPQILNTPSGEVYFFRISIIKFWVQKFPVIERLFSLCQETRRVEAEGDKTVKVDF